VRGSGESSRPTRVAPSAPAESEGSKVRIAFGVQWMAVQPDRYGQKWNFQLIIAPVLPKLIRGNLIEPSGLEFGLPK